ncbi:MAG: nucleoside recognition domain-containing protein, partial [Acutalibacteraceae bacterium]
MKSLLLGLFVFLFLAVLLIFPSSSSEGVKNGLNYSANLLLPSLFPFMVLSSFVIRSGFSEFIGKALSPVIKFLFGLPAICSSAIILSFVGGFPVGAQCVQ